MNTRQGAGKVKKSFSYIHGAEALLPDCWVGFMLNRDVFRFFRTKVHNFCHTKASRACFYMLISKNPLTRESPYKAKNR